MKNPCNGCAIASPNCRMTCEPMKEYHTFEYNRKQREEAAEKKVYYKGKGRALSHDYQGFDLDIDINPYDRRVFCGINSSQADYIQFTRDLEYGVKS